MTGSILEAIAGFARTRPERLCLADAGCALSYSQAWRAIRSCAGLLRARGVTRGARVAVLCTQDVRYLIACHGVQLAGAVSVPVERSLSPQRVGEIIAETEAALYIGQPGAAPGIDVLPMDSLPLYPVEEPEELALPAGDDVAEILFSTGTTGRSKGVVMLHCGNVAVAENVCFGVGMRDGNVELITTPLSHSHGLRRHYANLLWGNSVVVCGGVVFIKQVFELMDRYKATAMDIVPSALAIVFKLSGEKLGDYSSKLDYVQLGSAPLPEALKQRLCALLPRARLYNIYGSTESGCSCILDFNKDRDKSGCIGKPSRNSRFAVLDAGGEPLAHADAQSPGYLASAGGMNMLCYYRQPELTDSVRRGEYIVSRDLGYIDEDGYVYMLGRDDDVINYGGIKIAPEEIESAMAGCPLIKDCACVPKSTPGGDGQVPVLFAVSATGELDAAGVNAYMVAHLDKGMVPRAVLPIGEIPRTYNGKIRRKELAALLVTER